MTLEDVREFAWAVSDWCYAQSDLAGYWFDPLEDGARVQIIWRDGRFAAREFTVSEIRKMSRVDIEAALVAMAAEIRDPARLPAP
jgi:hypothetical protein